MLTSIPSSLIVLQLKSSEVLPFYTEGPAGPSGVDALAELETDLHCLWTALAGVARRICTTYVDPSSLMAYT